MQNQISQRSQESGPDLKLDSLQFFERTVELSPAAIQRAIELSKTINLSDTNAVSALGESSRGELFKLAGTEMDLEIRAREGIESFQARFGRMIEIMKEVDIPPRDMTAEEKLKRAERYRAKGTDLDLQREDLGKIAGDLRAMAAECGDRMKRCAALQEDIIVAAAAITFAVERARTDPASKSAPLNEALQHAVRHSITLGLTSKVGEFSEPLSELPAIKESLTKFADESLLVADYTRQAWDESLERLV